MKNDNIQEFIELYNTLDDLLRDYFKEPSRNFSMITRYINKLEKSSSKANQTKARKIDMIRILRNDLVHEFDLNSENLLSVSDETLDFIKELLEELRHPLTAYNICTRLNQLYIVNLDNKVAETLKYMSMHGFTQVPVLDANKRLNGVFTPNTLFAFLAKNGLKDAKDLVIKDLNEELPINSHISEKYGFISRDSLYDEVVELYDVAHITHKKLVAIFVTENGNENEKILGMIVPTDLLEKN